jgi:outer membrane immunogenic protein
MLTTFTNANAEECCPTYCCDIPECWQGFYLSGELGIGWNNERSKFTNANYFNTLGPVVLGSKFHSDADEFVGGAALGYNYQYNRFIVGLEAGVLGTQLKKSRRSPFFSDVDTYSINLQFLANTKLRVGYTYECLLMFITGGWAGGDVKAKFKDNVSNITASSRTWINGWTIGLGADYRISECFSFGVAYDYSQLKRNHESIDCSACGTGLGLGTPKINTRLHVQTLLFRLNYHFDLL